MFVFDHSPLSSFQSILEYQVFEQHFMKQLPTYFGFFCSKWVGASFILNQVPLRIPPNCSILLENYFLSEAQGL